MNHVRVAGEPDPVIAIPDVAHRRTEGGASTIAACRWHEGGQGGGRTQWVCSVNLVGFIGPPRVGRCVLSCMGRASWEWSVEGPRLEHLEGGLRINDDHRRV